MLELVGNFFGEEEGVCGGRNKWRGATMGPRDRGARPRGAGAPWTPRGQVVGPPGVFSVPIILKYSGKIIFHFQGIWRTFIFGVFFIARIIQKTDRKYYFLLYLR